MEPIREPATAVSGETPTIRLFSLLELIAARDELVTLQGLVEETGMPKPTLHRMLQQLEGAGLLVRQGDGRHYGTGFRLRRLAENLLLNSTLHGARHAVLSHLVAELKETCNLTTLSGGEVVYLDRVETSEPLRFYLRPGSRVPAHCSASGKILLSQLSPAQRGRLLGYAPLPRYTANTITDRDALEQELARCKRDGFSFDDEEFLPGLVCVAVLVPSTEGRSNMAVAVQAPIMRLTVDKGLQVLPALQRAAQAIGQAEAEAETDADAETAAFAGREVITS
jgi:IclR family acetate operon transcriptional repressor